jgi:hypothetical protein
MAVSNSEFYSMFLDRVEQGSRLFRKVGGDKSSAEISTQGFSAKN